MKLRTLEDHSTLDQVMWTALGFSALGILLLSGWGLYFILSQIPLKILLLGLLVFPLAIFVSWNIGYQLVGSKSTWKCGCNYSCRQPIKEWWHRRKCLSHILNGKN